MRGRPARIWTPRRMCIKNSDAGQGRLAPAERLHNRRSRVSCVEGRERRAWHFEPSDAHSLGALSTKAKPGANVARAGKVRIGISGWTYPPWRKAFYPEGLPQHKELAYAAGIFRSIEINGRFYWL